MSAPRKLRARMAAIGLALSSLAVAFNTAAAPPAPAQIPYAATIAQNDNTAPQIPAAPVITQQDRHMLSHVEELVALGKQAPIDDAAINRKLDEIVNSVRAGANPHLPAGQLPGSVFTFMVVAANEMERPDVIAALIAAGADINTPDQRGLRAIDYALLSVTNAQRITRARIDTALTILHHVEQAGAKLSDTRLFQYITVKTHKDLAINIVGMAALLDAGLVTQTDYDEALNGPQKLADMARNLTDLSLNFLRANGAVMVEYPDAAPGGPEPVRVAPGDTLQSLATRFAGPMGAADDADALRKLAARNNITLDASGTPARALTAGEILMVPLPPENTIGVIARPTGRTMIEVAQHLRTIYYNPNATVDQILDDLARLNNMTRAQIDAVAEDKPLLVTFRNDSYTHMQPLTPPPWAAAGSARTYLIITESSDYHAKQTYRVAMGTNYGINPNVDLTQFLNWDTMMISYPQGSATYTPSDAQHILMNLRNNPLRDRIVFSHSMGLSLAKINPDATRNDKPADLVSLEQLRIYLQKQELSRPIIFNAAGNEFPGAGRNMPPYLTSHSPRTINVGAVGKYPIRQLGNGANIIAPYSTLGGELCAVLPTEYGKQMEGTSFTTPLLAGVFRQFIEWYGDDLSYEEIMAAGMMTATRDILDLDTVNGYYRSTARGAEAVPALFRSNGAGLPYSERCGPGIADFTTWNAKLMDMVAHKRANPGMQSIDMQSHWLPASTPASTRTLANGGTEYLYKIPVPENMTLGRLTFFVPQHAGAHSEVTVRTPSGFEVLLPRSLYDTISTHAFAYEDVKGGDHIEIRTTKPLAGSAAIMLRGHADGNAIQMLRDQLHRDGILPAPLRTFAGTQEVPSYAPPSRPIAPANNNTKTDTTITLAPGNRVIKPIPMPTWDPR